MQNFLTKLWNDESGQDLVEYALLIALIALLLVGAIAALRGGIGGVFNRAADQLNSAT